MVNQKEWDFKSGLIKPKPKLQPNSFDTDEKQTYFRLLGEKKSADSSLIASKIMKQNRSLEFKIQRRDMESQQIEENLQKKFRKNHKLKKEVEKTRLHQLGALIDLMDRKKDQGERIGESMNNKNRLKLIQAAEERQRKREKMMENRYVRLFISDRFKGEDSV